MNLEKLGSFLLFPFFTMQKWILEKNSAMMLLRSWTSLKTLNYSSSRCKITKVCYSPQCSSVDYELLIKVGMIVKHSLLKVWAHNSCSVN